VNPGTKLGTADPDRTWLYTLSAVAALILGVLFLIPLLGLITTVLQPGTTIGWFSPLQNNWLIILFKLNAGFEGVQFDQLYGPNLLDMAILALVAIMGLGLSYGLRRTSRIWPMVAMVIPLLGIVLFLVTKLAGRSGVMAAGLIISVVMLRSNLFSKLMAGVGILASLLLLAGDFGTTATSPSTVMASLMGLGYVLLMVWFFLIARWLLQSPQGRLNPKAQSSQ
jgi:hypothetical protein